MGGRGSWFKSVPLALHGKTPLGLTLFLEMSTLLWLRSNGKQKVTQWDRETNY